MMPKVLLIDDEAPLRQEVADWLMFEGYDVLTAENGRIGLETAVNEVPDLIVCDIAMPEMDGRAVLLEVRSNPVLNHIPFIFLTASASHESMRRGMNLGADDYLTKPFKRASLLEAIRSRLRKVAKQQETAKMQLDTVSRTLAAEKEKRLLKSRLVAMFSHDFRNPLSSIRMSAELLKNYNERLTPERKTMHLERIGKNVSMLLQMLDDMLAVAEMEHGQLAYYPETVDIGAFVAEIVAEFRLIHGENYQFVFEELFSDEMETDPKLLRQIVNNLLSNAVKYSPAGSMVTVRLQPGDQGVELLVRDQGVGIPAEDQAQLFDPFYRAGNVRSSKGTGLGLTIVKEATDLCGGEIRVISELDQGTTFIVAFPLMGVPVCA